MIRIDLHTHSVASHDGGIKLEDYRRALDDKLDYIAITDHNTIDFALEARKKLGDNIIVGEEIMTSEGEVIGLFLNKEVSPGMDLDTTIDLIRSQGGLVYIPHPFEKTRSGVSESSLEKVIDKIDIIEVINGRAVIGKKTAQAKIFSSQHALAGAASSDSHGVNGWQRTYSVIQDKPTKNNLVNLLGNAGYKYKQPTIRAILYPKYNKIKKVLS